MEERAERENRIRKIGYGNKVAEFIVDKGHVNGPEIHEISDTGIVTVFNQRTHKLITKLIARPGQLKRYFNGDVPEYLLTIARKNVALGYNH
jgi:hypothetical protein